jgi:2-amino-4-hydroxy-6-hydroxymethyldihydropteridine diphosphokinase
MSNDPTLSQPDQPEMTHTVYLALGSNLGERRENLAAAIQRLGEAVEIDALSSIYETEPVGYLDQPQFLNMVCRGTTRLSPTDLLHSTQKIESTLGRQPTFRNGPRPIDIDILLYDDLHIEQEDLTLPHPRMAERAFVLAPLAVIAPQLVHPTSGKTIQQLLVTVSQEGIEKVASELPLKHDRHGDKSC